MRAPRQARPRRKTTLVWLIPGALVLVMAAVLAILAIRPTPDPPDIDFTELEPSAAAAIQKQLDAVTQNPKSGQ